MRDVMALTFLRGLVGEPTPRRDFRWCRYCGRPCIGCACRGHRDLAQIEHDLLNPKDGTE